MSGWQRGVGIIAAAGTGVMGGLYFAFSMFVMPALRRLPADRGVAAMQAMNRAAPAPFMVVGVVVAGGASAALAVDALGNLDHTASRWRLVAGALYLATIVITGAYHIPRNNALDRLDASSPEAARFWADFVPAWTAGNHVRFALAAAASGVFAYALTLDAA